MPIAPRPSSTGSFALELGGLFAGWLSSVAGGDAVGTVVTEPRDASGVRRKHIGSVHSTDIVCELPVASAGVALWQALRDMLSGTVVRHTGAVVTYDFDRKELERREFRDALITEIGLPALDAASKDPATLTVTFSPESTTRRDKGAGGAAPKAGDRVKQSLANNFRVAIAGLEQATAKVSKLEALTITQTVAVAAAGELRDLAKEPTAIEFPNVVLTVAQSAAKPLWAWHEDFVIKGDNDAGQEKTGSIELLTPDAKNVVARIDLAGLGVVSVVTDRVQAGTDAIATVRAEMYCEQITLGKT